MPGIMTPNAAATDALDSSGARTYARFGQRVRRRYGAQLQLLPEGVPDAAAMQAVFDSLRGGGLDVAGALRATRQLVLERLMALDCGQDCTLAQVTACMTALAEWALDLAFASSQQALQDRCWHGCDT